MLFLDCVHQLVNMAPDHFSFNTTYLQVLWRSVCCGLYRDLLFNSAKEMSYSTFRKHSFNVSNIKPQYSVTGTLLRKNRNDLPNLKRTNKNIMYDSYNGTFNNNLSEISNSLHLSTAPKSSLLSLNISSSSVYTRKHSLMTFSSPDPTYFTHMSPLQGNIPTHPAALLWHWNFLFQTDLILLFDSISSLLKKQNFPSTSSFPSNHFLTDVSHGSAASKQHIFLDLNFSTPFLQFWTECFLKSHPLSYPDQNFLHPGFIYSNQIDLFCQEINRIRKTILHLQDDIANLNDQ